MRLEHLLSLSGATVGCYVAMVEWPFCGHWVLALCHDGDRTLIYLLNVKKVKKIKYKFKKERTRLADPGGVCIVCRHCYRNGGGPSSLFWPWWTRGRVEMVVAWCGPSSLIWWWWTCPVVDAH